MSVLLLFYLTSVYSQQAISKTGIVGRGFSRDVTTPIKTGL
jgi:hypothetical protein